MSLLLCPVLVKEFMLISPSVTRILGNIGCLLVFLELDDDSRTDKSPLFSRIAYCTSDRSK